MSVDIFKNTKRVLNERSKFVSYEGLNYSITKDMSLKELLLFIDRDIYLAVENSELPCLKRKFQVSKMQGQGCILATISEVQTDNFYNIKLHSLSHSGLASTFCDKGTFRRKLCDYIKQKIEQILWSYNRTKISSDASNKLRFKYRVQVKLEHIDQPNLSCEEADKMFKPYFDRVSKENEKLYGEDTRTLPILFDL